MKELRDLTDLTIHVVQPISDEETRTDTGVPSSVSVTSASPIEWAQILSRAIEDGFVPHTQEVNLRTRSSFILSTLWQP